MLRYDMLAATESAVCMLLHFVSLAWHSAPPGKCITVILNDIHSVIAPCTYGSTACC